MKSYKFKAAFPKIEVLRKPQFKRILNFIPVAVIMGFVLLPTILVFWISFFSTSFISFPPPGYSFKWYINLLQQSTFISAAVLSLEVALVAMVFSVITGMMTSLALNNMRRGREALQTAFLSPLTVPSIVTGIAIYMTFTMAERLFYLDLVPSMVLLVLGHIVITIPWSIRLISSGLMGINRSLEEAALNLGASRIKAFLLVVFPQIRPSLVAAAIFSFIVSFGNLEISLMLVSPGHNMLPMETLNYVFWNMDPTIAALSSVQVLFIIILLFIVNKFVGLSKVF